MIINPGSIPVRLSPITSLNMPRPGNRLPLFLGEDGIIYALHGEDDPVRPGDLRLGDDGTFHRVSDPSLDDDLSDLELD